MARPTVPGPLGIDRPGARPETHDGPPRAPAPPARARAGHPVQPVAQLLGMHIAVLGAAMLVPFALDLADDDGNADGMLLAALLTMVAGTALALLMRRPWTGGLTRQQAFLLTVAAWTVLPAFGALPFVVGEPFASYTDAYFESMSGFTTTGSTVFTGLDDMPRGVLLWRALLNWFGGLGIVIVAIIFLPVMRIGGMQFFHAVGMDISGEIIPRATQIAQDLLVLYLVLTLLCVLAYAAAGMSAFDAICHAMSTIATGGFANYDASFGGFGPAVQYAAIVFMALGAMPFIRFIELGRGRPRPLLRDTQIRAFVGIILIASAAVAAVEILRGAAPEPAIRAALFNLTSVITTTGFVSMDYSGQWSSFGLAVVFILSMVGGCSGSTAGAAKVFRLQILFQALKLQIARLRSPHSVFQLRYQGRPVDPEIVSSIMAFFFVYLLTLGIIAILLSLMGLDFTTALTAPVATVTNVGPGLGPIIGPAGTFQPLPDAAIWLLSLGMLLGRLEFISVLVLLTPTFWR
jgi:trk system potassium uptake protein TrkH